MKNLKYILLFLALINFNAQKKDVIPFVNDKPEKFDVGVFSKEVERNRKDKIYITDRENAFTVNDNTGENLISYSRAYQGSSFSGYDYSLNSLFGIYKEFHPNNILKTKGIYCWFGFKLGQWYHYNENGKLISIENTDEGWIFTYKMVLDYCKKNKISLERIKYGTRTQIRKFVSPEKKIWLISFPDKSNHDSKKMIEKTLHLDSKTGKLLNTFEDPLPIGG